MGKRIGLLMAALLLSAVGAWAQGGGGGGRQITGAVTATGGGPISGVAVTVTGTAFTTLSHDDGRYVVSAPAAAATLVFRRIGFKRKEVPVAADQATADVQLEADIFNLEAVVVTGQQTGVERRNAAISSTTLAGADVAAVPAPALDRALQGRVPGAYIQQNSGAPGGGTQVQIRGSNTVVGSADPLYVVDGVIVSDAAISTGLFAITASGNPQSTRNDGEKQDDPVNRITDLNPNDVESYQVLRGAAATSIYGSKGVNGVIIITTRRGQSGKPRASITQRVGFSELQRGPGTRSYTVPEALDQFASSSDTATAHAESLLIKSYAVNGTLPTYDHLRELAGGKPLSNETQIDLSGGSAGTRYFLSGGVKNDGGIIQNTGAQRQSLRANIDQSFADRLTVSLTSAFARTTTQRGFTNNDNSGASVTYAIAYIPGFVPLKPVSGVYPDPGGLSYIGANPLQSTALGHNDETALRFVGGLNVKYQALQTATQNLSVVAAGGMDFFNQKDEILAPPELYFEQTQALPGRSVLSNADGRNVNWNLNGIHTLTNGDWTATTSAGIQWEDRSISRSRLIGSGLLNGQQNVTQGSQLSGFEENTHERTLALYGQEQWLGMGQRLMLAGSVRAERSSSNGDVKKYYLFPSVQGSYRFPELLGQGSDVKVRLAYGETGNQPLFGQKFTTLQGGVVIGGNVGTVVGATSGDPIIKPELTREVEGGVDASFWNGRGSLELTLYTRKTSNLLVPLTPAPSSGFSLAFANAGKIQNQGLEIGVGVTPIRAPNFNWLARLTFTSLHNKVLELDLPGGAQSFRPANAGYGLAFGEFLVQVGRPITQIVGTDSLGNVVYLGQVNPKFRLSWNNEFTFHRATLSFLWDWQDGGSAQNQTLSLYDCNNLAPDGATAAGQARFNACINTGDAHPFVQSTSFLKLRNAEVALDLPEHIATMFGAKSARLSIEGVNLLTITHYFGYDPEVSNYGAQSITRNIDLGPYPPSRQFFFSIKAGF